MRKAVLWDFEGTLSERRGQWTGALREALDRRDPGHGVTREALRPFLQEGFPWHAWERPHPNLADPGAWWAQVEAVLARALEGVGYPSAEARALAHLAGRRYADPSTHRPFPETRAVLERLREAGWRHVILSNHVPELPRIVEGIGLADLFDDVLTSAAIGVDKPHPDAFRIARRRAGDPNAIWMVGDNPHADGWGAEQAGIPVILVQGGPGEAVARILGEPEAG